MKIFIILMTIAIFYFSAFAGDEHNHKEEKVKESSPHAHDDKHDHSEDTPQEPDAKKHEDDHSEHEDNHDDEHKDDHDDHAEESEENSAIGPDKGILEKGDLGFKLSPEAISNFKVTLQKVESTRFEMNRSGLIEIKDNKYVYVSRDGWIRKIPVSVISKTPNTLVLFGTDIKSGDSIIVTGGGFVRTAEIISEEGMAHGHSH